MRIQAKSSLSSRQDMGISLMAFHANIQRIFLGIFA